MIYVDADACPVKSEAETVATRHKVRLFLVSNGGLPISPPGVGAEKLLAAMGRDKKVLGKSLRFVLLRDIGDAFVTADYDKALLRELCEAAG